GPWRAQAQGAFLRHGASTASSPETDSNARDLRVCGMARLYVARFPLTPPLAYRVGATADCESAARPHLVAALAWRSPTRKRETRERRGGIGPRTACGTGGRFLK